jgi:hypothetical protein
MNTYKTKRGALRAAIAVIMAGTVALHGAQPTRAFGQGTASHTLEDRAGGRDSAMRVTLRAERAAAPGESIGLTLEAQTLADLSALQLDWQLPDGGALLDGPGNERTGPVSALGTVTATRRVRFDAPGVYRVLAGAGGDVSAAEHAGAAGVLFFHVSASGAYVTNRDEGAQAQFGKPVDAASIIDESPAALAGARRAAGADSANADPCFNVNGRVTRLERPPIPENPGYAANIIVPVRNARLRVRENDLVFDDTYAELVTDSDGRYAANFCDDDGLFDNTLEIYVELEAVLDFSGHAVVDVQNDFGFGSTYEYQSPERSSGGGALTINMPLEQNANWSAPFNIADNVFDAWLFWQASGGRRLNNTVDVLWTPGSNEDVSNYRSDVFTARDIVIADEASDPDEWDDSVIIHEFGHMLDDHFSCDDNPGGKHTVDQIVDEDGDLVDFELSWGEGYPNYYQSAVRAGRGDPHGSSYIDNNPNTNMIQLVRNLETYDMITAPKSLRNEMSIAAALWDLSDGGAGDDERAALGHRAVQRVYTDPAFASNGDVFDDACTVFQFLGAWQRLGLPADAAVADAVRRNLGSAAPLEHRLLARASGSAESGDGASSERPSSVANLPEAPNQPQYKWWQRHSVVIDTSASMTGLKFDAAKSVIVEQVNDLTKDPRGVEIGVFRFDQSSAQIQTVVEGRFFPEQILPSVNALVAGGAPDPGCPVRGLDALRQTAIRQHDGQAWLITDGDDARSVGVENLRSQLNARRMRGSIVLLAGCGSAATKQTDLSGAERDYLGLAADSKASGGIAPYLLTALGSGGQFLFVRQDQLSDAVKILRAGLSNSAGAGRWSDYVSDQSTFRYDELESSEYRWIDTSTEAGGTLVGYSDSNGRVRLSTQFPQFADKEGYLRLGLPVLIGSPPNYTDYNLLRGALPWFRYDPGPRLSAADPTSPAANRIASPNAGWYQCTTYFSGCFSVETKTDGDWTATTLTGFGGYGNVNDSNSGLLRQIQMLRHAVTGEVRYQYRTLAGADSGIALIGVDGTNPPRVTIANGDVGAARNNSGYKLYTAPPQPSKTFTVSVDSQISAVGFLQTGYSGTFERMIVRDPNGAEVSCADTANVLCVSLNNGLVQYVQVNVNGRSGFYTAVVDAGASGDGTFSFSALAASALRAEGDDARMRSLSAARITTRLGRAADGNRLSAWLQAPNGARFGAAFDMFDDGAHGDGAPGDGVFGSNPFAPSLAGVAYLWISGTLNGEAFTRSDPVPYNFQPLRVTSRGDVANDGGISLLTFDLENQDSVTRCYGSDLTLPDGWVQVTTLLPTGICLNPATSGTVQLLVRMSASDPNTLRSGTSGDVTVTFTDTEAGRITASSTVRVTRYRPADHIVFRDSWDSAVVPLGAGMPLTITALVLDAEDAAVADGTPVTWSASQGSLAPAAVDTRRGLARTTYTPPNAPGDYVITAMTASTVATVTIRVRERVGGEVELSVSPERLGPSTSATARAVVRDAMGVPLANALVRIGVEQDGEHGTLNGGEVFTGTTNAQGELIATFTKSPTAGIEVALRAELLSGAGGEREVIDVDRKVLRLARHALFLPVLARR